MELNLTKLFDKYMLIFSMLIKFYNVQLERQRARMERHSHRTDLNFTRCKKSKGLDADCGI